MGVRMGIFRVAKAIKILGHLLGWLTLAGAIAMALAEPKSWIGIMALGVVIGAVFIVVAHGAAWILEGFAPEK